jgi:hypothetical protein
MNWRYSEAVADSASGCAPITAMSQRHVPLSRLKECFPGTSKSQHGESRLHVSLLDHAVYYLQDPLLQDTYSDLAQHNRCCHDYGSQIAFFWNLTPVTPHAARIAVSIMTNKAWSLSKP